MSDLYGDDILLWSERQAALLRRMGAGERVNDQVDWANVADEIAGVRHSEPQEHESLLTVLQHAWTRATPAEREAFDAWRKSDTAHLPPSSASG
jgi:hypothetical protein